MPSRPVLIGRGLVTHTPPTNNQPSTRRTRVHYPESEPTNPPPKTRGHPGQQNNNGSQSYGGHSGRETPGPIPNPEVKPASANGTATDRLWESRTPPNIYFRKGSPHGDPFRHVRAFLEHSSTGYRTRFHPQDRLRSCLSTGSFRVRPDRRRPPQGWLARR